MRLGHSCFMITSSRGARRAGCRTARSSVTFRCSPANISLILVFRLAAPARFLSSCNIHHTLNLTIDKLNTTDKQYLQLCCSSLAIHLNGLGCNSLAGEVTKDAIVFKKQGITPGHVAQQLTQMPAKQPGPLKTYQYAPGCSTEERCL